jgi:hypothetical protein
LQKITNLEKLLSNLGEKDKPQERESRSNFTVKFEEDGKTSSRLEQKSARTTNILNLAPKKPVKFKFTLLI